MFLIIFMHSIANSVSCNGDVKAGVLCNHMSIPGPWRCLLNIHGSCGTVGDPGLAEGPSVASSSAFLRESSRVEHEFLGTWRDVKQSFILERDSGIEIVYHTRGCLKVVYV